MVLPKLKPTSAKIKTSHSEHLSEMNGVRSINLRPKTTKSIYTPTISSNTKSKPINIIARKNSNIFEEKSIKGPYGDDVAKINAVAKDYVQKQDMIIMFDEVHLKIDFMLDRIQKLESTISKIFENMTDSKIKISIILVTKKFIFAIFSLEIIKYNEHEIEEINLVSKNVQHNKKYIQKITNQLKMKTKISSDPNSLENVDDDDDNPAVKKLNLPSVLVQRKNSAVGQHRKKSAEKRMVMLDRRKNSNENSDSDVFDELLF